MFGRNVLSNSELLKVVNQRLARTGTSAQLRITVSACSGTITLTGDLQYAGQRVPIIKAATRVEGVRQVIDQMKIVSKKKC